MSGRVMLHAGRWHGSGLATLTFGSVWGGKVWTDLWTKAKLRKNTHCGVCDDPLGKGTHAYRPLGNHLLRMERLCLKCLVVALGEQPE